MAKLPSLCTLLLLALSGCEGLMADGPCPGCTPVFYSGLNGSKCFRIPTIIRSHLNTLLAFAENRVTDCGDNGAHHNLVLRRSSDNGTSWGPMITVMAGTVPCPGCPAAISNPNPVEVSLPNGSRAILLHYDTMNNPSAARHGLDMQLWSLDDGVTWHTPSVLHYPPMNNTGALIGPSVGIQASSGTIYFSAVFESVHFLYWSHDYGVSWSSSQAVEGISECSIAFTSSPADGNIIMNCRTGSHRRAQLFWRADGTLAGNVSFPAGLQDPGCQGSIVNVGGVLFTSNANSTSSRTHMAVKRSNDQGRSWHDHKAVWSGPSAYSQLVGLLGGDLGLLFEAGAKSAYETISFVTLDA